MPILNTSTKPWYRQFWPWFLLSIPIASIILSSIMLFVAINGRDTLVVDNYYKEGKAINQALEKDLFARELNLSANIRFETNQRVVVQLQSSENIAPDYLQLKLFHPTLADRDHQIQLKAVGPLQYEGVLQGVQPSRWYVDIIDDQDLWRLKGEIRLPNQESVTLSSNVSG